MLELIQLLMGMSIRRYLPAIGTAGLERSLVSGYSRLPFPPPIITARISLRLGTLSSITTAAKFLKTALPCVDGGPCYNTSAQLLSAELSAEGGNRTHIPF